MKNYFEEFYKRYEDLKGDLAKSVGDLSYDENLKKAISDHHQLLNNIIMAGLGMGTLYLRMGAVLMIAEKTNKSADENDISFLKVMAEKLIHKLPADGDWLEIWKKFLETEKQCKWNEIISKSAQPDIHVAFVSLRNDIAHQKTVISPACELIEIQKALKILDGMTSFRIQFHQSIISTENNEVYFQYDSGEEKLKISPFVQINKGETKEEIGILPYLFQGRYYKGAKFINPEGAETKERKDEAVDDTFEKIKSDISRFNGDKSFNFDEKINNYNEWCIGRENEVNAILQWINDSETDKNVLPIFATAGLGKGALVAELIKNLKNNKTKHLFHFCGSGLANNLQAILYSLIIQGGWDKDINEIIKKPDKSIWNIKNLSPKLQNRFARFPTQYVDVIELFQGLLISTEPKSEKIEIDIAQYEKVLNEIDDANKLNGIFSNVKKYLLAINEDASENHRIELLTYLTNLIEMMKVRKVWQEKYYKDLYEIHCSFKKYDFDNNLISLIPDEFQVNSDNYKNPKLKEKNKLVIIIDGLDEAAVADQSKRMSDWFYTYDDKGERKEKWKSPDYIKWIFTYRQTTKDNKDGFQFDYHEFNTHDISDLQPLKGLTKEAVKKGLQEEFKTFEPALTAEFIDTIIQKGAVK
jgi:hypothetical protein